MVKAFIKSGLAELSLRVSGLPKDAIGGSISSTIEEKRTAGARSEGFAMTSVGSVISSELPRELKADLVSH